MTLQSSGAISFGDINVELGLARTTARLLGSASSRALAGVASGAIRTAADFYGKSNVFFTTSLTEGSEGTYGSPGSYARKGYSTTNPPSGDSLFPAAIGSVTNSTITKPGGGTTTFLQFVARQVPIKSSLIYTFVFTVSGDQTGTWWTEITYPTITYLRGDNTGTYDPDKNTTTWSGLTNAFYAFTGGTKTLTIK